MSGSAGSSTPCINTAGHIDLVKRNSSPYTMAQAIYGAYHRGQIARAHRAAGETPVNTDFITFVREPGVGRTSK